MGMCTNQWRKLVSLLGAAGRGGGARRCHPSGCLLVGWLCLLVFSVPASAAVSFVGATAIPSVGGAAVASISVDVPAGIAVGDILLAQIAVRGGSDTTVTPPAGWSVVLTHNRGTTLQQAIFYRIADGSEAASYDFDFSPNQRASGGMLAYRGVDTAFPVNVSSTRDNASSSSVTANAVTPTVSDAMIVGFFATSTVTSFTPPAGMTERYEAATAAGPNGVAVEAADVLQVAAASSGNKVATAGAAAVNLGALVALKPRALLRADYRFDECAYTGVAGEVVDSFGVNHATPRNSLNTSTPGQVARMGNFDHYSRWAQTSIALTTDWSVSVWFQKPWVTGNAQYYIIGAVAGGGDLLFLDRNLNYRWGVYNLSGTTYGTFDFGTLSNGWHHMVVVGRGGVTELFVDGISRGTVARKVSGTLVYLGTSFDAVNTVNAQGFRAPLDEYMVWDHALNANEVASIYANQGAGNNYDGTARGASGCGFDHIRIEHSGSGVTCAPTTLTIKACADAACSTLISSGVTGTLTAGGGPTVNWVGGADFVIGASGSVTKGAQVTTAGGVNWGATSVLPAPVGATVCDNGVTTSCAFSSALAGFLFNVPNHASDTVQNITVSAVRQADNSLLCTPAFASVSRNINFNCSYNDPGSGTLPVVVGGSNITCGAASAVSLSFNASGVASTTVRYADVGAMGLTASFTGAAASAEEGLVMSGSDTFIAAPASFEVVPAGPYVAGSPFTVTVTAKNASGNTTPNFGKESTTENVSLAHTLTAPVGGNNPSLEGTTTLLDATFQAGNGVASASDIEWDEVGDIAVTATLTAANYLGSGLSATGSGAAGPFRPAYLETAVTPASGTFTYSGQPFTVVVTALNADAATTQNYEGVYARAVALTDANAGTNNSATLGAFANANVPAASFTDGVATHTTIAYTFAAKETAPLELPTSAPLLLRATDSDGVTSNTHAEGNTPIRSGRLRLINTYGSELLPARVEYRAEYWNGRWQTNTLDTTTAFVAANLATGGLTVNSVGAINAGVGVITFATAGVGVYDIAVNLNAAGVDTSCNAAHAGTPASQPWLKGFWSPAAVCGGVAAWAQDPNARVRLGSPRAPYIYLRERY